MSLFTRVDGWMSILAFMTLLKLFFLSNIMILGELSVKEIRVLVVLFLDFSIKGKLSARYITVQSQFHSYLRYWLWNLEGSRSIHQAKSLQIQLHPGWFPLKSDQRFQWTYIMTVIAPYFIWAGSLSTFALSTI